MCICGSKYGGGVIQCFLSQQTKEELAKMLPQNFNEMTLEPDIDNSFIGKLKTTIFVNGRIYTMDEKQPVVEAVVIQGNRILFAGSEEEAMKKHKSQLLTIKNLQGRTMLPGFIDPHVHMIFAAIDNWVDLGPYKNKNYTKDQVQENLRKAINDYKHPKYLLACQLFDPTLIQGVDVSREGLDKLGKTVPIFILEANGHVAHVNSAAFKLAKIDENTPDPEHGRLIRDEKGVLTGEIQEEGAIKLFKNYFPPLSAAQFIKNFQNFLSMCASKGCTSLHDCGIGASHPGAQLAVLFKVIKINRSSPTRYSGYLVPNLWQKWQKLQNVPHNKDLHLRINGMKCWADGSIQAGSAYMKENYLYGNWGRGHPNYTPEELHKTIRPAHDAGWQVGVHANGDAAIDMVLDAFEKAQTQNQNYSLRHRIQHSTICNEEQLKKMAKFQVSPSFLIGHVYYYGEVFEKILGEVRADLTDPVKSAYDKNLKPTLHSDYNCQPVDPLRCIYNAVTRKMKYAPGRVLNKDQCVTPLQAVQAMTINAAWQCHMEDIVGSIEVGKMADFVILEQDPVDPKTDPEEIINIKISETWMDGKPTFQKPLPQ